MVYEFASGILEIAIAIFQGYCLQYFCGCFLEKRLRDVRWNALLVIGLYAILKGIVNLLMVWDSKSITILIKQSVFFCALFIVVFGCYKAVWQITLFLVVTFMAVSEISVFLGFVAMQMGDALIGFWSWCMEKEYLASSDALLGLIKITVVMTQIWMGVLISMILYVSLNKIVRNFSERENRMRKTELLFLLVPGLVSLLICVLLRMIMITVEGDVPTLLYDRYPVLKVLVPAILLLSLLSIQFAVKLFQDMISLNREKNSRVVLEQQIVAMQEHMGEMERLQSGIRSIRHDMKNTLSIILQLAGDCEKEQADGYLAEGELNKYLSDLNASIDSMALKFKTGNTVADALLTMKYYELSRDLPNVKWNVDGFILPAVLYVHSFDLGVILGNALDNALEACRKLWREEENAELFIRLTSFQKGELLCIKMENSFNGNIRRESQSEFPLTDKSDRQSHGIGLSNIKHTVEKYEGAVDWKVSGRVFTLSVMLKNERKVSVC